MSRVIVIGGGPAGMIAAVSAAEAGHQVTLLEKNEKLGKKLFITGKGRCNLTNGAQFEEQMRNIIHNPKFLFSSLRGFTNEDIMARVEAAGCPLKTERGQRVFPVSDHSSDVIRACRRMLDEAGVQVRLNTEVKGLILEHDTVRGVKLTGGGTLPADAVIAATGGLSYPSTGSTGDGYRWAGKTGHGVTKTRPALVPLEVKEASCRALQGLSLKNVELSLRDGQKVIYRDFGEMLFTHFGVSGPLVLSASSIAGERLESGPLTMEIDLKPALDREKLDARLLRDFEKYRNKELKNGLSELLPARLITEVIAQAGLDPEKKIREITKEERTGLLQALKGLTYTVTGTRGYAEAIVTQGGISVKDIDPRTMESRIVRGLHFAGEVLDVDGLTGGFNLQIAWSTGWAAGKGVRDEH